MLQGMILLEYEDDFDIKLSIGELAYLVALIGGTNLRGIEYSFDHLHESELRQRFESIQQKLENKGFLRVNFDGTVQMDQAVHDVISAVAFCNRVILQKTNESEEQKSYHYYVYGGSTLEMQVEEDQCVLRPLRAIYELQATMIERSGFLQHYDFDEAIDSQDLSIEEIEENISSLCSIHCCHLENEQIVAEREVSFTTSDSMLYQIKVDKEVDGTLTPSLNPVSLQWVVQAINQIL
ncbi:hypothetical protein [Paenibacillus guangzhouensis]|uniref:hypothetical protein n=1 Tax=Paenibacillus guangzhouensis TaxID=1473112 RepID=UPI001266D5B7|nr:hypothetical protein [Paenibacillus guangzhouensis]